MLPSEREHDTEDEPGVARAVLQALELWAMLLVKLVTAVVGVVVLAAGIALFPVWACIRHTALPKLAFQAVFKVLRNPNTLSLLPFLCQDADMSPVDACLQLGYTLHVFTPVRASTRFRRIAFWARFTTRCLFALHFRPQFVSDSLDTIPKLTISLVV